jgi:hypothetical protein
MHERDVIILYDSVSECQIGRTRSIQVAFDPRTNYRSKSQQNLKACDTTSYLAGCSPFSLGCNSMRHNLTTMPTIQLPNLTPQPQATQSTPVTQRVINSPRP